MSVFNEFQGALDYARDNKAISADDHRALTEATRSAFRNEPDAAKREALRLKFVKFIAASDWTGLKALLVPPAAKTMNEQDQFDAMSPAEKKAYLSRSGISGVRVQVEKPTPVLVATPVVEAKDAPALDAALPPADEPHEEESPAPVATDEA